MPRMAANPYQSPRGSAGLPGPPQRASTRFLAAILIGIAISLLILAAIAITTRMVDDRYFHDFYYSLGPRRP